MSRETSVDLNRIVRAEIHPAIGVGRVGNSPDEYYLTPQVPHPAAKAPGSYRDANGAIKREAVEFRLYGYDGEGEVVAELNADIADIAWHVQLANLKAAWYEFTSALDLPEAKDEKMPRRNPATVDPNERDRLAIIASPQTLEGPQQVAVFDDGTFMDEQVYLGEIRTSQSNRLIVLGGHGVSNSPTGMPAYNPKQKNAFGNAIGWHDDTSDGPVDASVSIDGRDIPVVGAWVAFGPPKFAPDVVGWRTMYELLVQLFEENAMLKTPAEVSFSRDVYPILQRMSGLQWVNSGFAAMFGSDSPLDFNHPELIHKLSRIHGANDAFRGLRVEIHNTFRPKQNKPGANHRTWPWLYGDAFGSYRDVTAPIYLPLPERYERILKRWADGDFIEDWGLLPAPPSVIEEVPLSEQPDTLTKASLHFCAADAFHPGIELTWPMRHVSLYEAPFRIRRNAQGEPARLDYGDHLTQKKTLAPDGPLHGQGAGGLTRWMLVPWQVDTAGCRSGYDTSYNPNSPSFWPAHVPNQVMTGADYDILMDTGRDAADRLNAFHHRVSWYDTMPTNVPREQLTVMVTFFGQMGIIEAMPGPKDLPGLPETVYVQTVPESLAKAIALASDSHYLAEMPAQARVLAQSGYRDEEDRALMRQDRFGERS